MITLVTVGHSGGGTMRWCTHSAGTGRSCRDQHILHV